MFHIVISVGVLIFGWLLKGCFERCTFWNKRNIPNGRPHLFLGNLQEFKKTKNLTDIFREHYRKFKTYNVPFSGFFYYTTPAVILHDNKLIKNVLTKDYKTFNRRDDFFNSKDEQISGHLANLNGEKWKTLRSKITSSFSIKLLKNIIPIFAKVGEELQSLIDQNMDSKGTCNIDIKELISKFTIEGIGRSAFGINCNCVSDDENDFLKYAKRSSSTLKNPPLLTSFMTSWPKVANALGLKYYYNDVSSFFVNLVRDTIKQRQEQDYHPKDFLENLIVLNRNNEISIEEVVAQTFIFLAAGNETSALTITYCLYELAINKEIQNTLRNEIETVLMDYNYEITYESVLNMKFLDRIFKETLRRHFMGTMLKRICDADYQVDGTEFIIPKGTLVIVPVEAIHMDSEYYAEPEKFDPDRFLPEVIRSQSTFLPFGDGPRNCIGSKYGELQTKIGIISIVSNYFISTCTETENPIVMDVNRKFAVPKNGVFLNLTKC